MGEDVRGRVLPLLVPLLLALVTPGTTATEPPQDDCGSGADAPYAPSEGVVVVSPVDCVGFFADGDERDSYRFEAPPGMSFRVNVTSDHAVPVVVLFQPDHGHGASFFTAKKREAAVTSLEPGLWEMFLYLCTDESCRHFAVADYRLRIERMGTPHQIHEDEGRILLASPLGTRVNRALGPGDNDGLDGSWRALPARATGHEFIRLSWDAACPGCLHLEFSQNDGKGVTGGLCGRRAASLECFVPLGAERVLVSARSGVGTDVGWRIEYWHPATQS